VTLPDVRAVTWERPACVGAKPELRYRARLTLPGAELWRCGHWHAQAKEARRCGTEQRVTRKPAPGLARVGRECEQVFRSVRTLAPLFNVAALAWRMLRPPLAGSSRTSFP
jgi:hypothetical protein